MSRLFLADATRWATTSPQKPVIEKEDAMHRWTHSALLTELCAGQWIATKLLSSDFTGSGGVSVGSGELFFNKQNYE